MEAGRRKKILSEIWSKRSDKEGRVKGGGGLEMEKKTK